MRLVSWNVNGIRAVMKKDFHGSLKSMKPDVLCLQETKAQDDQVLEALEGVNGFHVYSNSAVKKGYSGTAILTKKEPLAVDYDIGIEEHDQEGVGEEGRQPLERGAEEGEEAVGVDQVAQDERLHR